jgi:hypothetical protein
MDLSPKLGTESASAGNGGNMSAGSGGKFLRFSPPWYCTVQDWVIHKKTKKTKKAKENKLVVLTSSSVSSLL